MAKYDIHFQGVPADVAHGYRCFEFGYQAALKVTGFQSLINRWVKTLVTPAGSDPFDADYGTSFGNLIGANIIGKDSLIEDTINIAILEANTQVRKQDVEGDYDSTERLASAEVIGYEEQVAGFSVWVRIRNQAGDSAETLVATIGESKY